MHASAQCQELLRELLNCPAQHDQSTPLTDFPKLPWHGPPQRAVGEAHSAPTEVVHSEPTEVVHFAPLLLAPWLLALPGALLHALCGALPHPTNELLIFLRDVRMLRQNVQKQSLNKGGLVLELRIPDPTKNSDMLMPSHPLEL